MDIAARVANPSRLKAEIRIAETQARDIQVDGRVVEEPVAMAAAESHRQV